MLSHHLKADHIVLCHTPDSVNKGLAYMKEETYSIYIYIYIYNIRTNNIYIYDKNSSLYSKPFDFIIMCIFSL